MLTLTRALDMTGGDEGTNPARPVRTGQPYEAAEVACFLASDEASLVKGALLPVGSGASRVNAGGRFWRSGPILFSSDDLPASPFAALPGNSLAARSCNKTQSMNQVILKLICNFTYFFS